MGRDAVVVLSSGAPRGLRAMQGWLLPLWLRGLFFWRVAVLACHGLGWQLMLRVMQPAVGSPTGRSHSASVGQGWASARSFLCSEHLQSVHGGFQDAQSVCKVV